jgi:myosin heavy subunit
LVRPARWQEGEDQTILVSGESGAGKTESTRRVLEYLVKTSSRLASSHGGAAAAAGHLQNKLLQSNPLLETLGNAKTMRNDNSSRFGKFIQVYFDANCAIAGGTVRTRPAAHDPPHTTRCTRRLHR